MVRVVTKGNQRQNTVFETINFEIICIFEVLFCSRKTSKEPA